jgi:hypothetical protein
MISGTCIAISPASDDALSLFLSFAIVQIFKVMDQWGFSYVESFAWVQQTVQ